MTEEKKPHLMRKAGGGIAALVILVVALAALNIVLGNARLRADLTEEKLYSLSQGTRNILTGLDNKVELKFFFNSSEPDVPVVLKNYARQVQDLLHEYELAADGKVTITKLDPKPLSDAEDWAQRYGVRGHELGRGNMVYLGLVAVCGTQEQVLPVLDWRQQQLLEYNVTRLIYQVTHPKKPVIGLISSLPVLGEAAPQYPIPGQPRSSSKPAWVALQELQANYEVQDIPTPDEGIPATVDTLLIIHPKELSDATLYAIDQYVLKGGHAVVLVDPLSFADQSAQSSMPYGTPGGSSDLKKLFNAWGVGYDSVRVLADLDAGTPQSRNADPNPLIISLNAAKLNTDVPSTAQLDMVQLAFAGTLQDNTDSDLEATPLLTSSANCGTIDQMTARFGQQAIMKQLKKAGSKQVMGMMLQGTFKTAFPDGPPPPETKEGEEPPAAPASTNTLKQGTSAVVVVADVDLIFDQLCVRMMQTLGGYRIPMPLNDNISLFVNLVEQATGNEDLISIRSRGQFNRPFTYVDELVRKAQERGRAERARLEQEQQDTEKRLRELQSDKAAGSQMLVLSDQQREELENFRKKKFETDQRLKELEKDLMHDVEVVGAWVKGLNIFLMPALVGLAGIILGLVRKRRA